MRVTWSRMIWPFAVLVLAAAVTACGSTETATPCPPSPTCPPSRTPEAEDLAVEVPFLELWSRSGHADETAEAFRHWDEDDPAEVPTGCAKCHSASGYKDFLGMDGSEAGVVDRAAAIDTVIDCTVCHNVAVTEMTSVTFPSGLEVTGLGDEARCYQCHQGRASTASVQEAIEEAGVGVDTVSEGLGFVNIHYYAAAASRLGTQVQGGYQYEGKAYDSKFAHVQAFDTCFGCHDSHSLEIKLDACGACHPGVDGMDDLKHVRLQGSTEDYDGDGDVEEGVYYEIEALQETLLGAIQTYAADVVGTPIVYNSAAYPYFFIDTNEDGQADEGEISYGNQYASWTPRLLKAAYNYQTSIKDPGGYAHGGKYHIELLYDSIEDLDGGLVAGLTRTDVGHFDGSSETFRHWDGDGAVPGSCAKCHSASGLPTYLAEGANVSEPITNGFECRTCHDAVPGYTLPAVAEVTFPSGESVSFGEEAASNLCLQCHQGRESTVSVRSATAGFEPDAVSERLSFLNVHYFAAGATAFGTEAKGAYEYEGRSYAGKFAHDESFNECTECHDPHGLNVVVEACRICHDGVASEGDLRAIRETAIDFDGDGNVEEGIAGEIETLHDTLYSAIQAYAADVAVPLVYDGHAYPYFFVDSDGDGEIDSDEANYGNRYTTWTPRLLKAAYNYQYATKDTGAYTHNAEYILQVLYDSLADLGADTADMVRPTSE